MLHGYHLLDRRGFLQHAMTGLSGIAFASMLAQQGLLGQETSTGSTVSGKSPIRPEIDPAHPFAARPPHQAAAAKRVLVIF